jgi:two-component system response regulator YesN
MLTLMIVDDEKTTRESLAKYVDWDTAGIGSVKTARNGIEALALAGQAAPEIVLTDIRMPKMDGLQLAEKLKALNPSCKVVFLSGYADKEYLKKAIHLQAVSYVEKPVDIDEVKSAVRMAVAAFEREAAERSENARMRARSTAARRAEREELTRRLVTGEADLLRESPADAGLPFEPGASFTLCALRLAWSPAVGEREKARLRKRLLSTCARIPPFDLATSLFGFVEKDVMAAVAARKNWSSRLRGARTFDTLLWEVRSLSEGAFDVSIGIGEPVLGLAALPVSYASALESLGSAFYRETEHVFFPGESRPETFVVRAEDLVHFRESLRDNDIEKAVLIVGEMETAARLQQPVDIDSVRDAFFALYLASRTHARAEMPRDEKGYIWRQIQETRTLSELARFILQFVGTTVRNGESRAHSRTIREIQRFIRDNYTSAELTLAAIADHAALSRTYVSSLYKAATGKNVTEYLTDLRIEKAKELLTAGRAPTRDVARSVGYRDANYFSALFKKRVGRSPTAFRESE